MSELELEVCGVEALTPLIKRFHLRAADGGALPGFTPGAHLRVQLPLADGTAERHYSLVDLDGTLAATAQPTHYTIAVRLEDESRGGSHFMHNDVAEGTRIRAQGPLNEFPLDRESGRSVLIAGGIGITPLISMAAALQRDERDYHVHYSGRSRAQLAFVHELTTIAGERLALHADDEPDTRLDVAALLAGCRPTDHLYVCGPKGLIDAVIAQAGAAGWPQRRIHFEFFTAVRPDTGDHAFEVECRESGVTVHVPADQTILEALMAAGLDPLFDCQRGECGVCSTPVLEGEVDHRDYYLSDDEKASNEMMQICISRAKGERLVLDL